MKITVKACGECDSADLKQRKHRRPVFKCHNCGAEFDEPVVRRDKRVNNGGEGIAESEKYDQIREALEEIVAQNKRYVRASQIGEMTDIRPQIVGRILGQQGRAQGDVVAWRENSSSSTLWKITIDEPREVSR
jgi:hypothetical protein